MRVAVRRIAFVLAAVPLVGVAAVAQLPAPGPYPDADRLKADTAALAAERRAAAELGTGERAVLIDRLNAILDRMKSLPPAQPLPPPRPPAAVPKVGNGSRPVDALGLAMNLARDDEFEAALGAFRQIDPATLAPADRAFVRYMTASCLRRLGRTTDALVAYRDVAEAPQDDEFLAGCAVWQVSMIRSNQELQAQLEQLRARAKGR
ncbi:MAG: hypothetical protein C0501_16570 [Isosphaera sp.]|nr:hypothetical protein [Isosphaera sp.]